MFKRGVFVVLLFLTACAARPDYVRPGLQALEGKNIRVAIDYLGYPDMQQEVIGDTVYQWHYNQTVTDVYPITDFDRSRVELDGKTGTVRTTSRTYVSEINSLGCRLKIATDKNDIIKAAQASSIAGGCRFYNPVFEQLLLDFGIPLESLENSVETL